MERNQAASRALLEYYDKESLSDMDDFSEALWTEIAASKNEQYRLEIFDSDQTSLDFMVKLLVKIGFTCEDAVRLMMYMHKHGSIVVARSEEHTLLRLQDYINAQARMHSAELINRIIKH
tara:strand:+ start:155 stop:514 length:360 start_codon:yes stop_codon:yes gene_type:complete